MAETTTRQVGDVIEFPGKGRVRIDWISEDGWIGYRVTHDDYPDSAALKKRTLADFEASVALTVAG